METAARPCDGYIVIVDEDELLVRLLVTMFQSNGLLAHGYTSVADARKALEHSPVQPGLLIANHDMPETCSILLAITRQRFPQLQCILMSGNDRIRHITLPDNTRLIYKPILPSKLFGIARTLLSS